jgi:thiosulfate/3-mercaptopyruvate sulfurtransferase
MRTHCTRSLMQASIATLAVAACATPGPSKPAVTAAPDAAVEALVSTAWLSDHLADPDLVILDCTVTMLPEENGGFSLVSGRAAFDEGHIPSAGFADLKGELADPSSPHKFALPSPEQVASALGALGVGDASRVVLYDAENSGWAARVWWMLRWIGFDRAAILDGGLAAWKAENRPLSTDAPDRASKTLSVNVRPHLIADKREVLEAIDGQAWIIDSLPEKHFRGEMAMYDRPGHIPGASNLPSISLTDTANRYRPLAEFETQLGGRDRDARVITYCGGGIAASAVAFTMARLGYTNVAVYTASLQEWAADPEAPMVTETTASSELTP